MVVVVARCIPKTCSYDSFFTNSKGYIFLVSVWYRFGIGGHGLRSYKKTLAHLSTQILLLLLLLLQTTTTNNNNNYYCYYWYYYYYYVSLPPRSWAWSPGAWAGRALWGWLGGWSAGIFPRPACTVCCMYTSKTCKTDRGRPKPTLAFTRDKTAAHMSQTPTTETL